MFELVPGWEHKQENIHLEGAYFLTKKCQMDTGIVKFLQKNQIITTT